VPVEKVRKASEHDPACHAFWKRVAERRRSQTCDPSLAPAALGVEHDTGSIAEAARHPIDDDSGTFQEA